MAISKINGFAAPYRSLTFRQADDILAGRSGLLRLDGAITEAGGDITVPGLAFIQQGLLVSTDETKIVTISSGLEEPYYLTVRAASVFQSNDLIYGFAKAPEEVSDELIIVAEKANGEWRPYYEITIDALVQERETDRVDLGFARPLSGLRTTFDSPNLVLGGGVLIDKQGTKHSLVGGYEFTPIDADPDFPRVDRLVFRRAVDDYYRIGSVVQIPGGTFSDAGEVVAQTTLYPGTSPVTRLKTLVLDDNSLVILAAQGFGETYDITYTKYSSDRLIEQVAPTIVLTGVSSQNFDAHLLNGQIYVAYREGDIVKMQILTANTGAAVGASVDVSDGADTADKPTISSLPNGQICILFEQLDGALKRIYLAKKSDTGSTVLPPVLLTPTAGVFGSASLAITSDSILHVAYADEANGKILFGRVDDIGDEIDPFVDISDATTHPTHGTLTDGASKPVVKVADNKQVFVLFLQEKPSTAKGIAIYTESFANMYDLVDTAEDFSHFDFEVSPLFNSLNILTADSVNGVNFIKVLEGSVEFTINVSANDSQGVSISFDRLGSFVHAYSGPSAGTFTNVGAPVPIQHIGSQPISGVQGSVSLNSNEFMVNSGDEPIVGQRVTIAGSGNGNDGNYIVSKVTQVSIDAVNDFFVVTVTTPFAAQESNPGSVTGQYASPDGNQAEFVKSVSDKRKRAYLNTELETDVLLAKIVQPGNVILNYIPNNEPQSNSDTLGIFGDVVLGWENAGANLLQITGTLQVLDFFNNLEYQIPGGTFTLNEGDALYAVFNGNDLTPSYQIANIDEIEWDQPIQVMGFIKDGSFWPSFLIQADVGTLDSGEIITIGEDLPAPIRSRLGITSESSFQAYTSVQIISPTDNYPEALSKLDQEVANALSSVASGQYFESVLVPGGGLVSGSFITLPLSQQYIIGNSQLKVFFDGQLKKPGLGREYVEVDDGGGLGTTIQILRDLAEDVEVFFAIINPAASGNSVLDVQQNGTNVASNVSQLNFEGSVVVSNPVPGKATVFVPTGGGGGSTTRLEKQYQNGTLTTIPAYRAVAFLDDGTIALADANVLTNSDFCGITMSPIDPGNFGVVAKAGNIPGILTALGINVLPGKRLYVSETPGEITDTAPVGGTVAIISVGAAEPPDNATMGANATDLYLLPEVIQEGS